MFSCLYPHASPIYSSSLFLLRYRWAFHGYQTVVAYQAAVKPGTPPPPRVNEAIWLDGSQNQAAQSETSSLNFLEVHTKVKLHSCAIYAEDLRQCHTGSLVVSSITVSPYVPRFVGCVGFLVVPLTPLGPIILLSSLLPDSQSFD